MRVAIIGAGLTGLTAARTLIAGGIEPVIFDKSRGVGGRLSTRRAENGLQFDHGAQYLPAKSAEFASFLNDLVQAGAAAPWTQPDGDTKTVGLPGMSGIAKHLAEGLNVRHSMAIEGIRSSKDGWQLGGDTFDRVISTVPAPQAEQLFADQAAIVAGLAEVEMTPNLTLMAAFEGEATAPFVTRRAPEEDLAWVALDSAKPGRGGHQCWVAQGSLGFSTAHLELSKEEIAALMLPKLARLVEKREEDAIYVAGHRWRYAQASKPLGQPFLSEKGEVFVGGDWALSARAEGAWQSGRVMAQAVLDTR